MMAALKIIGDMMGLESVNELNRYYYGLEEPTYEFIEKYCVSEDVDII